MILGYTSLVNEVNVLKKFRSFDANGICKESDDVLIIEMIKVNSWLYVPIITTLKISIFFINLLLDFCWKRIFKTTS